MLEALDPTSAGVMKLEMDDDEDDDDDAGQWDHERCEEAETAINEALPAGVRKFFAYGTDNGMIGLIPMPEFESMFAFVM